MANFSDLIGAYLQNAAAPSGQNRMGNVLQTLEKAAAGGLLGGVLDAMQKGAAQVYAASLLAIEVDTDAERNYLQQLAQRIGLQPASVQHIHQAMGLAV